MNINTNVHIETQARRSLLAKKMADGGYTIPAKRQPSVLNNHKIEDVKRSLIVALNSGSPKLVLRALTAFRNNRGSLHASLREIERQALDRVAASQRITALQH